MKYTTAYLKYCGCWLSKELAWGNLTPQLTAFRIFHWIFQIHLCGSPWWRGEVAQQYHGHRGTMGMVTAQHMGNLHTWTDPEGCRRLWKITFEFTPGNWFVYPALATAETNCFSFPKQDENIRFNGSFLCWKRSKAINCCRFLQSFTFHGRFSTQALLPAVC